MDEDEYLDELLRVKEEEKLALIRQTISDRADALAQIEENEKASAKMQADLEEYEYLMRVVPDPTRDEDWFDQCVRIRETQRLIKARNDKLRWAIEQFDKVLSEARPLGS